MKTQSSYLFLLSFLLVFFSCTDDPEAGCIDELACNYNSEAEEDDGSCEYAATNSDCNGDCLDGYVDVQGECVLLSVGCMDALACNYNSEAEEDDGSCEYITCSGCTNPNACNYNSDATISDDESCQFPLDNPINITSYDDLVVGQAGAELISHFYIQNASCSTISIDAEQITNIHSGLYPGVQFRICLGDYCYDVGETEAVIPLSLDSFEEGDYFQGYLMSPNPASFNITYRFFTESNYEERTVEFQFN